MKQVKDFRTISARERALSAIAVLLDGREAQNYLAYDAVSGEALSRAAAFLSEHPPELRMPFAGTMLRMALEEMTR